MPMLRLSMRSLWVCLVALWVVVPAEAQTAEDLWRSMVEFGFTGASGNTSFSILSGGFSVNRLERERFELDLSAKIRWGKSDGEVIANDIQGTIKFDWSPQADFSPFVYATASRDVIRNLDGKFVTGGGVKWTLLRWDSESKLSFSLAGIVDHENFRLMPDSPEQETVTVDRWSTRVKFDHTFGSGATFQHITFWQPRVSDFSDYIVSVENSLSSQLHSNLSLVINHSYIHDEIPPPGAVSVDQRFAIVLRVSL